MAAHWDHSRATPIVAPGSVGESEALMRIDELRAMDMAGEMISHPDSHRGLGFGPFYRRGAPVDRLVARRAASTRHWRRKLSS